MPVAPAGKCRWINHRRQHARKPWPGNRRAGHGLLKFFIDRPIFAAVLSIVIFAAGLIAIPILPISEYPEVVPPAVIVRAIYPGANPRSLPKPSPHAAGRTDQRRREHDVHEVGRRVRRRAADDHHVRPGTDPDAAQVRVQNRVSQALSRLPSEVVSLGVTTRNSRRPFGDGPTALTRRQVRTPLPAQLCQHQIKDELARLPGVGQVQIFRQR